VRVLTFLHSFEPGGVERDALRLNAEWARLGVDAQIVLGRNEGKLAIEAPKLPYMVLQRGRFSTAAFETLWMIAKLPAAIRTLKPDILFCAGNTYTIVAVMMRFILGAACPPIVLRISNDLERADLPWPVRKATHGWVRVQAPVFSKIVAMAAPLTAQIQHRMTRNEGQLAIIDNASITRADITRLSLARSPARRAGAPDGGRHFVSIGRLAAQKNWPLLIRAFHIMRGPHDRLTIAGEGGQRARLERLIEQLGLGDSVSLPGHIWPVDAVFADADVFVLPSDYEGLPAVVIEALAAGVPIVATQSSDAMPMLVENAGIVTRRGDPSTLAQAMRDVSEQRFDPDQMSERAHRFTVEQAAPRWIELFASLMTDAKALGA
jgi:glycosyltransferase involved in cell wall biosynthesis